MNSLKTAPEVPQYVPSDRVCPFNPYTDHRMRENLHEGLAALQRERPDIFYTPTNGGHWVATRFELLERILKDHENFSSVQTQVPLLPKPWIQIPLHLDPPAHTPYRMLLMRYFSGPAIRSWEHHIREDAVRLVDEFAPRGRCEFAEDIALHFPVSVSMKIMGWPIGRMNDFRDLAVKFFSGLTDVDQTMLNITAIQREVKALIVERRERPDDGLVSQLISAQIEERRLSFEELESICFILFLAGLDSVASTATFLFHHLAQTPDLQQTLGADLRRIDDFLEEGMRKFGMVSTVRTARHDVKVGDVDVRAGDPILCVPLAGLDERRNPNPAAFRLDRPGRQHMIFGGGVHLCIGNALARRELRILTEVWLQRIPRFKL
jgi:cytochrome P450